MSGLPDGSEGRGVETFPSASNAHVTDGPKVPTTSINPQQSLESCQPTKSVDRLGITNVQPAALNSTAAAFAQLIYTASATFGVTLGAPPAQDLLGIGQVDAAIAPLDLAQADAGAGTTVVNVPAPVGGAPADSVPPQAITIPNAALGTIAAIDAQEVREGDNVDRYSARRREGEQRESRLDQPPPRPAESRLRPGTHQYRNARESRLREFMEDPGKRDSYGSGVERLSTPHLRLEG